MVKVMMARTNVASLVTTMIKYHVEFAYVIMYHVFNQIKANDLFKV